MPPPVPTPASAAPPEYPADANAPLSYKAMPVPTVVRKLHTPNTRFQDSEAFTSRFESMMANHVELAERRLVRRWHDLMDVNAGTIATGEKTIADVGWEMFHLMLDVASGRKQTCAEKLKIHNALVLFNPAPVT